MAEAADDENNPSLPDDNNGKPFYGLEMESEDIKKVK